MLVPVSFQTFPESFVPPGHVILQVLGVDDTGAGVLAGFQLHRGDEPALGAGGVVAERGAVGALGMFGVDDGGAPVADGLLPWLQVHLGPVAPPGAVVHRHHCLTEGGGGGHGGAADLLLVMLVRVVLHLRAAPGRRIVRQIRGAAGGNRAAPAAAASLDLLLRGRFDLDALAEEHRVHAGLGVGAGGAQQQVRQLWTANTGRSVLNGPPETPRQQMRSDLSESTPRMSGPKVKRSSSLGKKPTK